MLTHSPCVNVECKMSVKRAIILICANHCGVSESGGLGALSLEANKVAVILPTCGSGITAKEQELCWIFTHQDER